MQFLDSIKILTIYNGGRPFIISAIVLLQCLWLRPPLHTTQIKHDLHHHLVSFWVGRELIVKLPTHLGPRRNLNTTVLDIKGVHVCT